MPIGGSIPPQQGYQPLPTNQQPQHPGYATAPPAGGPYYNPSPSDPTAAPNQPVWGQPIAYGGGNCNGGFPPQFMPPPTQQQQQQQQSYESPIPPPPSKPQQQQQPTYTQQQQPAYPTAANTAAAYPAMPIGGAYGAPPPPVRVDALGNATTDWASLVLQFPRAPNGAPTGFPENPLTTHNDTRWVRQDGNATDEILENRICVGVKLKDCELRNCFVYDCTVKDSLCKGGYYGSSKLKECEFQNTSVIISSVVDDSIAKWSGLTNCDIKEGDLQKCNSLDCRVVDSNVFGGTAVRCNFSKCGIQNTHQEQCHVTESSTSARQCVP